MSEPFRVIRIKLQNTASSNDGFAVLFVFKRGSNPLDLEIVASEGELAFATTVRSSQVNAFRDSSYEGTDASWQSAIKRVLLLETPTSVDESRKLQDIECTARLRAKETSLSLIWRRQVGEITQRLGTIDLPAIDDPGDKFDLFSGCAVGAKQAEEEHRRVVELQSQVVAHQEQTRKLQQHLDDLIKAKEEHENELLHKFAELLNAKKSKIRDQQRLLASASLDPAKVETLRGITSRKAESSRASKRKAAAARSDDGSSDDGFEKLPAEGEDDGDEDERMQMSTPDPLEDETASDGEDGEVDNEAPHTPPPSKPKKGIKRSIDKKSVATSPSPSSRKTARNTRSSDSKAEDSTSTKQAHVPEEIESPPPRRDLPFRKAAQKAEEKMSQTRSTRSSQGAGSSQTVGKEAGAADDDAENDETEDEDDEL